MTSTIVVEPALERIVVALRAAGATITAAQATKAAKVLEPSTLEEVGQARARAREAERELTARAVAGVIRELDRERSLDEPDAKLRPLARKAGVSHQAVYNELERRAQIAERHDALESNGHPPAAPHDDDREAASEPTARLSGAMRDALEEIDTGGVRFAERTVKALRGRGLIRRDRLELTRAGRELLERGGAA